MSSYLNYDKKKWHDLVTSSSSLELWSRVVATAVIIVALWHAQITWNSDMEQPLPWPRIINVIVV